MAKTAKPNVFRGTVEEYRALYMEKNAHLEQFLEQVISLHLALRTSALSACL